MYDRALFVRVRTLRCNKLTSKIHIHLCGEDVYPLKKTSIGHFYGTVGIYSLGDLQNI